MVPALLCMVLSQTAAPSSPSPRVAVFAVAQSYEAEQASGTVELALVQALKRAGVATFDPAGMFPQPNGSPALEEGRRLSQEGIAAWGSGDLDVAAERLKAAAISFIRHPAESRSPEVAKTLVLVAAVLLQKGETDEAEATLSRALSIDPSVQVDAPPLPTEARQALEDARGRLNGRPRGTVVVTSVPTGATVEIGGVAAGTTPLPAREHVAGRLHVRMNRPGYAPYGAFPDIVPGKVTEVRAVLEPLPGLPSVLLAVRGLARPEVIGLTEPPRAAVELAHKLNVQVLLIAEVRQVSQGRHEVVLHAWHVDRADALVPMPWTEQMSDASVKAFTRWLHGTLPAVALANEPAGPGVRATLGKLSQRWWFWAAVGGVALAAGGTYLATHPRSAGMDVVLGTP